MYALTHKAREAGGIKLTAPLQGGLVVCCDSPTTTLTRPARHMIIAVDFPMLFDNREGCAMTLTIRFTMCFLLLALVGCTPSKAPAPIPSQESAAARTEPTIVSPSPAARQERCLPVIARECGCVYSCGVGFLLDNGRWSVKHAGWKDLPLTATIQPWCVGGECTDVFDAEIVCAAICRPKPADPTCHFDTRHECISEQTTR